MRGNTIIARPKVGTIENAGILYQYDYGQRLIFEGITLPDNYEVHFANPGDDDSVTMIGDETGVDIPDILLTTGKPIHVWIYLHDGASDGETEYHCMISVMKRSKPTNSTPTPVQQDAITQAIAALNEAVEQCDADVEHYPTVIDGTWHVWNAESEAWVDTGVLATGEKGDKGDTGAVPNITVGTVTTGEAGTDASVTRRSGSPDTAPIFDFTIPKGAKGDPGDLSQEDIATVAQTQEIINEYEVIV